MNVKKPEDWYNISMKDLKVKKLVQSHYGGSLKKGIYLQAYFLQWIALMTIYPEHKFDASKFVASPGYWSSIEHQREFFNSVAHKLNITKPENWYTVKFKDL